jgi:transcriptional regulator with XRE-family HTH domain
LYDNILYIDEVYEMKPMKQLLRELREDNDLKQSEVATLIGTTQQQYSNYETGESELPLHALAILADHYNVSADYLMGRTECREGVTGLNRLN